MIIPQTAIDEIASEAITDTATVGLDTAKKAMKAAATVTKAAISVKGTIGKSSITRMGKDSILEFPTVMPASIEVDDQIAIAKMFERQYATLLVSIFSLRPTVSLNEFDNIAEYIKSIHSNNAIPSNLLKTQHFAHESVGEDFCLAEDVEPSEFGIDGTILSADITFKYAKDLAYECWGHLLDTLDRENLNDVVQPYKRSQHLLNERLNLSDKTKAAKATEAFDLDDVDDALDNVQSRAMAVVNTGRNSSTMFNKNNLPPGKGSAQFNPGAKDAIKTDNKVISMEPTMINLTFYLHGSKDGDKQGASFTQSVAIGVKAMVRSVSSEYMVSNLVEGSKSSNPIFKLIAWTRGEARVVKDLIFNIGEIKKKFKTKNVGEFDFLEMSKNRKNVDDVSKFAGNRVLPYLSLVVTDYEAAQAAQVTGVDLTNFSNAKAFMDRYYLLAFAIYNPSSKTLNVLYDGAHDWETMSMTYIQTSQKKDMDITKSLGNLASIR